jgi:DNA-binding NtrC family response regulator
LLLAQHYINTMGSRLRLKRKISSLSPEVATAFRRYSWPGNVRELRNVIERALILEDSDRVTMAYLPRSLTGEPSPLGHTAGATDPDQNRFTLPPEGISLDEVEMSFVKQAIDRSEGNQTRAAELLGISRDQLRYRLKKLDGGEKVPVGSNE